MTVVGTAATESIAGAVGVTIGTEVEETSREGSAVGITVTLGNSGGIAAGA